MILGLELDKKYQNKNMYPYKMNKNYQNELRKENFKTIDINHLLALCELGENYQLFCYDLEKLIKSKTKRNLVKKLYNAIEGSSTIVLKKYKKFIEKHQDIIAIMNKYYCLYQLTVLSYDQKGDRVKNLSEDYFYQYLQNHKKDIETIKEVVLKIKNLGFNEINLNENFDFTKKEYEITALKDKIFGNERFSFLESMEIIPTDSIRSIKYRTNDSCYCMDLECDGICFDKYVSNISNIELIERFKNIKLNSLVFDSKRLPNKITKHSTLGVICELNVNKMKEHENLRPTIDLRLIIDYLKTIVENLSQLVEENQTINSDENITEETIQKEKKLQSKNKNNK